MYDLLRMLLEAISIKNNFKINNHECYNSFLKEILKESRFGDEFDKFRKIRNKINYYGENIGFVEGKIIVDGIIELIFKIKKQK